MRLWLVCVLFSSLVLGPSDPTGAQDLQLPWKHQIIVPDEPFQSWTSPAYVKFTIILQEGYDPNLIYYQDSSRYEYHFEFALENLEPFIGMSLEEFDQVTLFAAGQQAALGAVIVPPWSDPPIQEYGIQLARTDRYTPEETVRLFNLIKSSVIADPNVKAYYFPTYEQYPMVQQNRDWFQAQGVPVGSTAQWTQGNASYSPGWVLGTLKFIPGSQIQEAYTAGSLACDDILLTDGVPAEVPSLAGIVTLAASTPNSHVAILARSQGVPFVHLARESDASLAKSLVGKRVYLAVTQAEFAQTCEVKLYDVESLSEAERASLLSLKKGTPLVIQPMASPGRLWSDTNDLRPADIRFFGGKASNFGVLRRAFREDSPRAMAFSFDLWNAFLDQGLATQGGTLRELIRGRLAKYSRFPPADLKALSADLASIRDLFKDTQATHFGQEGVAVLNALREFGFDPGRNIRFRSSTNVEDSDQFTGAGLYDSFSGCLADDEDGDAVGPCLCDSSEKNERGVLRAIRKVFASFYNDNAFLERLKHGVNEADVGMALLVHHSFPDEIELANGVATLERTRDQGWLAGVVSQKGAVSVTNPPMDAVPEEVRIEAWGSTVMPQIVGRSSLVSLRENTVLEWDAEYLHLYELLTVAARQYCVETQKEDIVLDFEFKKVAPEGRLVIKQIREVPRVNDDGYQTVFLLGSPKTYWTLQGRGGNVFANHRLKSRWTLRPKNVWLDPEGLRADVYDEAVIEYVADGQVRRWAGGLASLPEASHRYEPPEWEFGSYGLVDDWHFPDLANPRAYRLATSPLYQGAVPDPVVTLDEFRIGLEVEYRNPVRTDLNDVSTATVEEVSLYEPWQPTEQDAIEECSFADPNLGVSVTTRFYWRWGWGWDSPASVQFESTRIEGLTSEPIFLTGYFSQSVGGGAHLCPKNFLFEPGLEPGISQRTLDELRARNVRLVYFTTGARECRPTEKEDTPPMIRLLGFDEPIE